MIRRGFTDIAQAGQAMRQVHYRHGGEGSVPLLMLHASPGSSRQLVPMMETLSSGRHVVAPDTPGNGDSPALPEAAPDIAAYAKASLAFMESLGLAQVDVYGSHTGAAIAMELSLLAPDRVRRVVIDGLGHFSDEDRALYLERYAQEMSPDLSGAYLQTAFTFLRDQYLFWPWFARDAAHRRIGGLPEAGTLHVWLVEVLKALETYHLSYRAAFAYPTSDRLVLISHKTLVLLQDGDALTPNTQAAARLLPNGVLTQAPRPEASSVIDRFLRSQD